MSLNTTSIAETNPGDVSRRTDVDPDGWVYNLDDGEGRWPHRRRRAIRGR
jgi:hypothetical protein